MLIERTYAFQSNEERQELSKETYLDFIRFIKDYSLLIQQKNITLDS